MSELLDAAKKGEWDMLMVRRLLEVVRYLQRMQREPHGSESMLQILNRHRPVCQGPSLTESTAHPVAPVPMVQ